MIGSGDKMEKKEIEINLTPRYIKRRKGYKIFLKFSLLVSIGVLLVLGYKSAYNKVPTNIKLKVGVEQVFEYNIPVNGEIRKIEKTEELIAVSGYQKSNIPQEALHIDLSDKVTMRADSLSSYQMDLKLFGILPFKKVNIEVIQDATLIPVGSSVGIYVKTEGILVVGVGEFDGQDGGKHSPAKYLLKSGDYIIKVNGKEIDRKAEFVSIIENSNGEKQVLTIKRGEEIFDISIQPVRNQTGEYKVGIWIRDNAQGVGTLTFVDSWGNFGALGHGISDVDTGILMSLKSGTLYKTEIIAIRRGTNGSPGEMTGMIEYADKNILGEISANTPQGIFGLANEKLLEDIEAEPIPIGLKQDIELAPAQILCSVEGKPKYYDIVIKQVDLENTNLNRGILLTVTDPELLALTGGIVQGMSGAPIIQNGKLIGAVTHVLVQDPTSGYGIFIETMLAD